MTATPKDPRVIIHATGGEEDAITKQLTNETDYIILLFFVILIEKTKKWKELCTVFFWNALLSLIRRGIV